MTIRDYTIIIVPQKGSSVKRIYATSALIKFVSVSIAVLALCVIYFSYDYVKIKGKAAELAGLKRLAAAQKDQIDLLAGKVGEFEKKMTALQHFDRKIRIMTNLEGGHDKNQLLGIGGPIPEESDAELQELLIVNIRKDIDRLLEEATFQDKSFRELSDFLTKQQSALASTPSIWPVMGWVSSEFGYRTSPFTGKREFHRGIDIATRAGKEIVAPAGGIVTGVSKKKGMGNMLRINHQNGISTCYGHLLKSAAKNGQRVKRGDVIGYLGNSGRSTGPHLHYGIYLNGVPVNPRRYLF